MTQTLLESIGAVPVAEMPSELRRASRGIPLWSRNGTIKAFAMVEAEDFGWLSIQRWYYREGYAVRSGPRTRGKHQSQVRMHRVVLGLEEGDGLKTDHINHDTLDNRRANLRIVTHAQNHQNRRSHRGSSSRFRGVSWDKAARRWRAYGCLNGEQTFLGYHEDESEAADAAAAWREIHMPYSTN